jgi:dTDP-glucose 4,6-dehydratase
MDALLKKEPAEHILNVGNEATVSILDWVKMCYDVVGAPLEIVNVDSAVEQRKYFSFYDYDYTLDISEMKKLLPIQKSVYEGLKEAYDWYLEHPDSVIKRDYMGFIDTHFA